MKTNEIDDGPNTISYNSLDNEEGYSKTTESNEQTISHEILSKPKTMKNNCVNLKCMDNVQKLWAVKEQYKQLEKKYFEMESSGSKRCEEFEELLHKKENDLNRDKWVGIGGKFEDGETLPIGRACDNCDVFVVKEDGTKAKKGEGLLIYNDLPIPFSNIYPRDNIVYDALTTDFRDNQAQLQKRRESANLTAVERFKDDNQ